MIVADHYLYVYSIGKRERKANNLRYSFVCSSTRDNGLCRVDGVCQVVDSFGGGFINANKYRTTAGPFTLLIKHADIMVTKVRLLPNQMHGWSKPVNIVWWQGSIRVMDGALEQRNMIEGFKDFLHPIAVTENNGKFSWRFGGKAQPLTRMDSRLADDWKYNEIPAKEKRVLLDNAPTKGKVREPHASRPTSLSEIEERTYRLEHTDNKLTNVHQRNTCGGPVCAIHALTDHPLREMPQSFRWDNGLMERTCEHGIGHPDPDSVPYFLDRGDDHVIIHGCDGCCNQ